jgi:hypothetical protein
MGTPISGTIVREKIRESKLACVGLASIRELNRLVGEIEEESGQRFIRMEMGIPGMTPPEIAVEGRSVPSKKALARFTHRLTALPI